MPADPDRQAAEADREEEEGDNIILWIQFGFWSHLYLALI